ncbi:MULTISPECIES: hypothetical protein [unclassified Streptosporangium]|nr:MULTISPECIES: hypothetical protein [unclassified Streptosporangium]
MHHVAVNDVMTLREDTRTALRTTWQVNGVVDVIDELTWERGERGPA